MKQNQSHDKKAKAVKNLVDEIKKSKTLMIVSIKSLPSRQFQDIKKAVREHAKIKVAKKNIMMRAVNGLEKPSALELEKFINENCAFAISNLEGFELAGIFFNKKNPMFAKAGQIAPVDIEVKAGPTNLVPGPAISELGALGLQVSVENGKLSIKSAKVVAKQGQTITEGISAVLQKLNIQPFSVGLEPLAVYDIQTEKIYSDIKIDSESARKEILFAASKALGFAQKLGYYCKETIGYFLAKANMEAKAIENKTQLNKPEETA
ncbi:MAG: 50S ribosomal protein L10 [Candidatus Nanoarchaeia archaeon]|nr:50S ribosomal protein L10 [Candidatus Nanoarchaeia archaeon]